jgi:hypothetical protein
VHALQGKTPSVHDKRINQPLCSSVTRGKSWPVTENSFSFGITSTYETDYVGVVVTYLTCIWKVPSSNLERDTSHSEGFRDFPPSLQANSRIVSRLDQIASFQILSNSAIRCCIVYTFSIIKYTTKTTYEYIFCTYKVQDRLCSLILLLKNPTSIPTAAKKNEYTRV